MTIKVKEIVNGCFPVDFENGEWVDLCTAEDVMIKAPQANKMHIRSTGKNPSQELRTRDVDFDFQMIPLGIAMQLPSGMEAHVLPRSSTFKRYGLLLVNSQGIIDGSYCGDGDEWKYPVIGTRKVTIPKGTRIAQFRIQLSQKATVWQKMKWLFSSGVKIRKVASLDNPDRGGFGSTGK